MNTVRIQVSGIVNTQMKTSLKNALNKIDGVQAVDIDRILGKVEVGFNNPANENSIRNCIEEAGFSLT